MNVASNQLNTARSMARAAEQKINSKTGLRVTLMMHSSESNKKPPEQMLGTIAAVLNMTPETYKEKSRKTDVVELRFIAAHLLRRFYPRITLKQIGVFFGGKDHTSIINAIVRADELLYVHDPIFSYKYSTALNSVTKWLKEQL